MSSKSINNDVIKTANSKVPVSRESLDIYECKDIRDFKKLR